MNNMFNLPKYRILKRQTNKGDFVYIVQKRICLFFWRGMFRSYEICGGQKAFFSTPRIYFQKELAVQDLGKYILREVTKDVF